jgi:hypothetical protein
MLKMWGSLWHAYKLTVTTAYIAAHLFHNADALFSSLHSFYNCHEQQCHLTALLISLRDIPNHRVVVLTYSDQSVDSCWNCAVHNLHRQANLHCTLGTRFHVSVHLLSAAGDTQCVCKLQYVLPLSITRKLLAFQESRTPHLLHNS